MKYQLDTLPLCWALHRLGGIVSPANSAYSVPELVYQLKDSKAKALFTCAPLLPTALEAAAMAGISEDKIYLLEIPQTDSKYIDDIQRHQTASHLIEVGKSLTPLENLRWSTGEGARRTAFLCYSSGTSGLPVRESLFCSPSQ